MDSIDHKGSSERSVVALVILGAGVVAVVVAIGRTQWRDPTLRWFLDGPFFCGFLSLGLLWLIALAFTGNHPWDLVQGQDGRASSSKLQLGIWTVAAIFAYVVMTVARIKNHELTPIASFPPGLLLAMGFSSSTAVAAKGITSSYVASGRVAKTSATDGQSVSDLVTNDGGQPDLIKFQMLAWTIVAVAIFLVSLYEHVYGPKADLTSLPDIDETLAVLMGIGHGTYVFHKLTLNTSPVLTGISPSNGLGKPQTIKVRGSGFGGSQNGNAVTIDGVPVPSTSWTDTDVALNVPPPNISGPAWVQGKQVRIGITVNGQDSNTLPFSY